MPFKPSLVALKSDPTSAPYIGYPFTEIILEEPNSEGATTPFVPSPDARDKITESVTGSDVRVVRRSLSEVELEIDYVDGQKKGEIERLYYDKRSVYLSPNAGVDTVVSCPLQRSVEDWMGFKTFEGNHTNTEYHWDEVDKVFRSWGNDDPVLPLHGHWTRYFCTTYGMDNEINYPHPTSSGTGWSFSSGSGVIAYEEEILTPVLSQRNVTNEKGVTVVEAGQNAPAAAVVHSTGATLGTTTPIGASVCIMGKGAIIARLETSGGTLIESKTVQGTGQWQLVKLRGNNPGSSTCRIKLTMADTIWRAQVLIIGPCFIGNEGAAISGARVPDWSPGVNDTSSAVSTDSNKWVLADMTLSFFWKFAADNYCGFFEVGGSSGLYFSYAPNSRIYVSQNSVVGYFYNFSTEYPSISDGDWVHMCFTGGATGFRLYVNGVEHSDSGTFHYIAQKRPADWEIGLVGSYPLIDSGISHLRLDKRTWSQAEVRDHYDTYFSDHGRGAIEPTFMKELIIEDMEWEARVGSGSNQWLAKLVLRELGADEDHAPMQRQEDQ